MKAPEIVFNVTMFEEDERGIFRLFIAGSESVIIAFFMTISKYVETRKTKWIVLSIGLFVIIVLHATRQIISISLLVALFYLLRKNKYLWIYIGIVGVSLFLINKIAINENSVIRKLVATSEEQLRAQQRGEEYVRVTEYRYFFTEYSKNIITCILGNGIPHSNSAFGKMEDRMHAEKYLYVSDVGYAQQYVWFGLTGLVLLGIIFYRALKQKIPSKYMYAKLFMIYIVFVNIASTYMTYMIMISICLYILECNYIKPNENKILNRHTGI
jgi:hypothetical protein